MAMSQPPKPGQKMPTQYPNAGDPTPAITDDTECWLDFVDLLKNCSVDICTCADRETIICIWNECMIVMKLREPISFYARQPINPAAGDQTGKSGHALNKSPSLP